MWALWLCACEDKDAQRQAEREALRQRLVSSAAPAPGTLVDATFGESVRLLGYDAPKGPLLPGRLARVTWYWQVLSPLPDGYRQFTHLTSRRGSHQQNLDRARVLLDAHPPKHWRAGEFLTDPQEFTVPEHWRTTRVNLSLGFYRADERLPISAGASRGNAEYRVQLPVKKVRLPPPPLLRAAQRESQIRLDGLLDESDWQRTEQSGPLVRTLTGAPGTFRAWVRVLYDQEALYVAFVVQDTNLQDPFTQRDAHLWEQDTVEVMLDPDGDGRNYFEIQVSPANVLFDTRYKRRRYPRPFGDVTWDSKTQAGVQLDGTLNDDRDDRGYTVEMRIPIVHLVADNGQRPQAPQPGTVYRMNFFVMNRGAKGQQAVGFSPPMVGDFHTPERFGRIRFE